MVLTDAAADLLLQCASAMFRRRLFFPPGSVGPVPKVVLNTVRVPLSAFGGVNLHAVRSVQFTFNERAQGGALDH